MHSVKVKGRQVLNLSAIKYDITMRKNNAYLQNQLPQLVLQIINLIMLMLMLLNILSCFLSPENMAFKG